MLLCMVILILMTHAIEAIQLKIVVVFSNLDKAGVAVGVQETIQPVIMLLLFIWLEPCRKGFL